MVIRYGDITGCKERNLQANCEKEAGDAEDLKPHRSKHIRRNRALQAARHRNQRSHTELLPAEEVTQFLIIFDTENTTYYRCDTYYGTLSFHDDT